MAPDRYADSKPHISCDTGQQTRPVLYLCNTFYSLLSSLAVKLFMKVLYVEYGIVNCYMIINT